MKTTVTVKNIKCGGCCKIIRKELLSYDGVNSIAIDLDNGEITINHSKQIDVLKMKESLRKMGYPEIGTVQGFSAFKSTAISFVNCALGRIC
jgi:copper chaperone